MDSIKSYLLSVVAAAILCGIVIALSGKKGSIGGLIKLLCGLFLAVTVIRPAISIKIGDFSQYLSYISQEGEAAAAMGEDMADEALRSIIKSETEAYILDKAASLEVDLTVEVLLSEEGYTPCRVSLHGPASPYAKKQLSTWIEETLGISLEEQIWTG